MKVSVLTCSIFAASLTSAQDMPSFSDPIPSPVLDALAEQAPPSEETISLLRGSSITFADVVPEAQAQAIANQFASVDEAAVLTATSPELLLSEPVLESDVAAQSPDFAPVPTEAANTTAATTDSGAGVTAEPDAGFPSETPALQPSTPDPTPSDSSAGSDSGSDSGSGSYGDDDVAFPKGDVLPESAGSRTGAASLVTVALALLLAL